MKTRFILLLILPIIILSGCSDANTVSEKEKVIINMPTDNTVNGYRLKTDDESFYDDTTISAEDVYVESSSISSGNNKPNANATYCANKNSKVFHKSDCGSVKKTKEENKFYSKDREQLISDGYTPCKQCKP